MQKNNRKPVASYINLKIFYSFSIYTIPQNEQNFKNCTYLTLDVVCMSCSYNLYISYDTRWFNMEKKSMTALISAFARAYHSENNKTKVFNDSVARLLISNEEYVQISKNMADGISFFNPDFKESQEASLRWIVDNYLSPTQLARSAFAEKSLETAVSIGASQYIILGAGYDTFAYRQPVWANKLMIFEVDHPNTADDKKVRLEKNNITIPHNVHFILNDFTKNNLNISLSQNSIFNKNKLTFCSILGVLYYLSKKTFENILFELSSILPDGSSIVFDYPDEYSYTNKAGERSKKQSILANATGEKMLSSYSYSELEHTLSKYGFLIYEHLNPDEMTAQYFNTYNISNPQHKIYAFDNTNYCLAVKK